MKNIIAKINNDSAQTNKNNNWNFDQPDPIYRPDLFEPFIRNEQTQQTR